MRLSRCCLGRWCHCHSFQSLQPLCLRFLLTHLQENGRGRDTKPLSLPGQRWEMPPWTVARLWQQLPAVLTWDSWSTVGGTQESQATPRLGFCSPSPSSGMKSLCPSGAGWLLAPASTGAHDLLPTAPTEGSRQGPPPRSNVSKVGGPQGPTLPSLLHYLLLLVKAENMRSPDVRPLALCPLLPHLDI